MSLQSLKATIVYKMSTKIIVRDQTRNLYQRGIQISNQIKLKSILDLIYKTKDKKEKREIKQH